jgi:hypothetical protein
METHTCIAHGKFIELDGELGFPDGQPVSVVMHSLAAVDETADAPPPKEDIRLAFGAGAEEAQQADEFLQWNRKQRKMSRPEIECMIV